MTGLKTWAPLSVLFQFKINILVTSFLVQISRSEFIIFIKNIIQTQDDIIVHVCVPFDNLQLKITFGTNYEVEE